MKQQTVTSDDACSEQRVSNCEPLSTLSKPKQFDFSANWRRKVFEHLDDSEVARCLTLGMKLLDINYEVGDPPWLLGRGPLNGQRARCGCLSWYQPWGRCHHIAPFCWALGQRSYPSLNWGFLSGELHTVVIGFEENWQEPDWVMDILLFKEKTAQQSIDFVKSRDWRFYDSLREYVATFFVEPQAVLQAWPEEQVMYDQATADCLVG